MSDLHVRQIKAAIEKSLKSEVDMSDYANKPAAEADVAFLSRALAAYAIMYLGDISASDAAQSITDGFGDNGLDAVYYHATERILYVVQSKWKQDGSGSIDRGDMQKFLKGFRDLIYPRWERFNAKLKARKAVIESALNDSSTRIVLVVVYNGQPSLSTEVAQDLQDVLDDINSPVELVTSQVLRQGDLYGAISEGLTGAPIEIEMALYDWGQVREPYSAFYGQVSASDVAAWYAKHHNRLFAPNIRMFLGVTEANTGIFGTLTSNPQDFWYFNNGITALCRTVAKKPIGGSTRETGLFDCSDLRIVNGAQTVGAIASANSKDPEEVAKARVGIRLISLDQCPPEFAKAVTRYNNTQNRIDRRDFVALDPQQDRIKAELVLEGISYVYKSGEAVASSKSGFDIVEATVARACRFGDSSYAVQAKREIGKLWEDIEKPPYTVLFNGSISGPNLWRLVQIVRVIEETLLPLRKDAGRKRLLAIHGNRFITHLVMHCLPKSFLDELAPLDAAGRKVVQQRTKAVFPAFGKLIEATFPDAYLASLFKNASRCEVLKQNFQCPA